MLRTTFFAGLTIGSCLAFPLAGSAQTLPTLTATVSDRGGVELGTVVLTLGPHGALVRIELSRLDPGPHAIAFHDVGVCSAAPQVRPEDPLPFATAGGHINPGATTHGFLNATGAHAGDLPNLIVPEGGAVVVEFFAPGLDQAILADANGTAFIVRARADDYLTGNNAGARIACGVVQ